MRTLILTLILASLFTLLAFWYLENPGTLKIQWLGYYFEMSIAVFFILTSFLIGGFYITLRLVLNIFHIPSFFRARYAKYNQMRGIHAIEDSLVAFLAQDVKLLKKTGKYVGSFLKQSPLNFFFRAEAALLNKDTEKAESLFKDLTHHESMAFAGYYGLMRLALSKQELPRAIAYGDLALSKNPTSLPVRKKIVNLSLETHNYERALEEIDILLKTTANSASLTKKKSLALYHLALEAQEKNDLKKALSLIEKSIKFVPERYDFLILHIELLRNAGKERAAIKAIEKTWRINPQKDLINIYFNVKKTKTNIENFKAVQCLASFAPDHPESELATAHYAIKAKLWGPAHDALDKLMDRGIKSKAVFDLVEDLELAEERK